MGNFKIVKKNKNSKARIGFLKTKSGYVSTPLFLPVATLGVVKTLSYTELDEIGVEAFITNTYHLYFRPGEEVLKKFGGLHKFINCQKVIFTDSGGFQVYSLRDLRKVSKEGVEFKSHIDGSTHFFTPQKVIELQKIIGSDVMLPLDECVEYPAEYERVKSSVELTTLWAKQSKEEFLKEQNSQLLFGIIQGSVFKDLRKKSVEEILSISFDGYAIGGVAVGEPKELMYEILTFLAEILPEDVPKYVMGVGEIEDIWEVVGLGYDIMDCVLPTRNGRNGQALTTFGKLNIRNSKFKTDDKPIDEFCNCYVCKNYSRALLHHYFKSGELLGLRLLSYHNVYFIISLMNQIRYAIKEDKFVEKKKEFIEKFTSEREI